MTIHNEIMNIPCEPIEGTESEVLSFKLGHKQDRHAAAELAARLSEWQNEAAAVLAHFVCLSSRPDDREWFSVASKVPALLGHEDAKSKYAIDDEEDPVRLSKAMALLESKEVQMRREQKLREEAEALTAKVDQLQRLNAIRYKEAMESAGMATAFRDGNTALIEALMNMANQFFHESADGKYLHHSFMSAEEGAIEALEDAGFAEEVEPEVYRLLWDKLEERKARAKGL